MLYPGPAQPGSSARWSRKPLCRRFAVDQRRAGPPTGRRPVWRDVLANRPPRATIYFLFRGDGPLALDSRKRPGRSPLAGVPAAGCGPAPGSGSTAWWAEVTAPPLGGLGPRSRSIPPLLENYLAEAPWGRRLNLRLPEPKKTESALLTRLEHEAGAMLETEVDPPTALEQDRYPRHDQPGIAGRSAAARGGRSAAAGRGPSPTPR